MKVKFFVIASLMLSIVFFASCTKENPANEQAPDSHLRESVQIGSLNVEGAAVITDTEALESALMSGLSGTHAGDYEVFQAETGTYFASGHIFAKDGSIMTTAIIPLELGDDKELLVAKVTKKVTCTPKSFCIACDADVDSTNKVTCNCSASHPNIGPGHPSYGQYCEKKTEVIISNVAGVIK